MCPGQPQPVAATDALQHVKQHAISDGSAELVHRCRARRRVRRASTALWARATSPVVLARLFVPTRDRSPRGYDVSVEAQVRSVESLVV